MDDGDCVCVCGRSEEEMKSSVDGRERERVCVRSEDKVKRSVYDRESMCVCACVDAQ